MNQTWVIHAPATGKYDPNCLRLENRDLPTASSGRLVVKTRLLSVDPTTRNWLKLENAAAAVSMLFEGSNSGKLMVRVSEYGSAER